MAYGSRGSLLRRVVILRGKPEVFTKTGRDLPGFWKTRGGLFAGKNANVGEIDKRKGGYLGKRAKSRKCDECRVIKGRDFVKFLIVSMRKLCSKRRKSEKE